jgi:hypothetical protein
MRHWLALVGFVGLAAGATLSCAAGESSDETGSCPVGSEKCPCTQGGSCDPGLECLSDTCVNPNPTTGSGGAGSTSSTDSTNTSTGTFMSGAGGGGMCNNAGCSKIDMLFALDGSGSMAEEIGALSASQAFAGIIQKLAAVNCGNIDYRIAVTDDNDGGFLVPNGWSGATPWFDSTAMSDADITTAFTGAANKVVAGSGTDPGCEHVLTSSANLLQNDSTGFLRPDALLVLVMLTDVDDYGTYDNVNGNTCGLGCTTVGAPVNTIHSALLALKGNDPKALATIVISGDPSTIVGQNFCGQPGVCGCSGLDCAVFPSDRLWAFAGLMSGSNGYAANLCAGASTVPTAVSDALNNNIDLACQQYVPQ